MGAALLFVLVVCLLAALPAQVFAGQASTGELFFYPCTSCHPVQAGTSLPNGFKRHQIKLVVHDKLGSGAKACLVCHDDPAKDPSKLKLVDGSLVDIKGDISKVCYRCHSDKYKEWEGGVHGKRAEKCTAAGCHDPHTPSWIYAEPTQPFVGTGFQARAVSEREPFKPFAGAPEPAGVLTPGWLKLATLLGGLTSFGLIGTMIVGRPKR